MFDDHEIGWAGETHVIPAKMRMKAIATVEEHITLKELYDYMQKGNPPIARLASAYAAVLRLIGVNITDEEMYVKVFQKQEVLKVIMALMGLISLMLPPAGAIRNAPQGKAQAPSA